MNPFKELFRKEKIDNPSVEPEPAKTMGRPIKSGMGGSVLISSSPDLDSYDAIRKYLVSNPAILKGEDVKVLRKIQGTDIDLVGETAEGMPVIVKIKKDARRSNVFVGRKLLEDYASIIVDLNEKERISKVKIVLVRWAEKGLYQNVWVV